MAWLSLRLSVPAAGVETLSDALLAAGALSITLRDAGDVPVLEPGRAKRRFGHKPTSTRCFRSMQIWPRCDACRLGRSFEWCLNST